MESKLSYLLTTVCFLLLSNVAQAADFSIPSLSRCAADMSAANTQDSKVYNIYSDFYYEFEDKRDYAAHAVNVMTQEFAAEGSSCRQFSQPMNRETIKCERFSGSDVCIVPSDAGEFIVVKDFVDSTNIVLTKYASDYSSFPGLKKKHDAATLWLPKPEVCYEGILSGLWDSQAYLVDAQAYTNYTDLRFVLARGNRDLVQSISSNVASCSYQTAAHVTSDMKCMKRNNKPSICSISTTGGGYFVYVTDENNSVHMIFNRWD